jgi:hypothetical protein
MIHSVPTKFNISNNEHLKMLRRQNNIPYDMLKKSPWLGQPLKNNKNHGLLLINVKDKQLAKTSNMVA